MKLLMIFISLVSLNSFASSEACKGYALNSMAIIQKSNQSYEKEMRFLNFNLQKSLASCDNDQCKLVAELEFTKKQTELNLNHKNYLQQNFEILINNCVDI